MNRKACEYWGQNPPPELAYVRGDRPGERRIVTWDEIMQERRARQSRILASRRMVLDRPSCAYRLWVAYFDQDLMGGWHAFIDNIRTRQYPGTWIDRDRRHLKPALMEVFPLVASTKKRHELFDDRTDWNRWKKAFAEVYSSRMHDEEVVGVRYVWWDGRSDPRPIIK